MLLHAERRRLLNGTVVVACILHVWVRVHAQIVMVVGGLLLALALISRTKRLHFLTRDDVTAVLGGTLFTRIGRCRVCRDSHGGGCAVIQCVAVLFLGVSSELLW